MKKVDCISCANLPEEFVIEAPDDEYFRERMDFLNELCYCWSQGCLSDIAAFTAAKIIISPEPISEEAKQWAIEVLSKAEERCL
jgi:hypothetical protein